MFGGDKEERRGNETQRDIKRKIKKGIERGSQHPLLESVFKKEEKKQGGSRMKKQDVCSDLKIQK